MGVDFGRLLENKTEEDEKPRPSSAPISRSNSRTGSITSLSSYMTIDTSILDPDEVILTTAYLKFEYKL